MAHSATMNWMPDSELWLGLALWQLVWCFVALLMGGLIKGAMGVGTPLLTVPMMAMVLPAHTAIVIMAVPVVVANVWQFLNARRSHDVVAQFWPTFVSILIFVLMGTWILSDIDERNLLRIVGTLVILFALLQLTDLRFQIPPQRVRVTGVGFGAMAGLVGGISSFLGPLLIVFMMSLPPRSKDEFVSSISYLYLSGVIPWAIALWYFGLLTPGLLVLSVLATLPVTLGLLVGQRLRTSISEQLFKLLIIMILIASGASMLWKGL